MSLLLDALKKAADDKQKAARSDNTQAVPDSVSDSAPEAAPEAAPDSEKPVAGEPAAENAATARANSDEALTLELDDLPADNAPAAEAEAQTSATGGNTPPEPAVDTTAEAELRMDDEEASLTISDEALSLLIDKTNHNVKHDNRLLIIISILTGILVVAATGAYYYLDTQEEIANLERRHRITMQQMRAKTSGDSGPEHTEIIRTLVSDTDLEDKVRVAKEHIAKTGKTQPARVPARKPVQKPAPVKAANKPAAIKKAANSVLSIRATNKRDPLDEMLQSAWLAYERGDYQGAAEKYRDVLAREDQNRDAMLGLAAIALIEKDFTSARRYYMALLELDPRDPDATAGLSSMQTDEGSLQEHEEYLLSMLQKNPGAAALNFALANVYARQGEWQSAQQYYFNAWQADADNADYIYNLAVSLDQLGKGSQALSFYRQSLEKAGNRPVGFSREAVNKRIRELSGV